MIAPLSNEEKQTLLESISLKEKAKTLDDIINFYLHEVNSNNQTKIAFTNTTELGVDLWILDLKTSSAKKVFDLKLNSNIGSVINWFSDSKNMLVKVIPSNKQDIIEAGGIVPS